MSHKTDPLLEFISHLWELFHLLPWITGIKHFRTVKFLAIRWKNRVRILSHCRHCYPLTKSAHPCTWYGICFLRVHDWGAHLDRDDRILTLKWMLYINRYFNQDPKFQYSSTYVCFRVVSMQFAEFRLWVQALILQQAGLCSLESSNTLKHTFNSSQVVRPLAI